MTFVTFDVKDILRRGKIVDNFFDIKQTELTQEEAVAGAKHARDIAPYASGGLYQAIVPVKGRDKRTSYIVSRIPVNTSGNNPRGAPYNVYLHEGKAVHVRNGKEQRYMDRTAEWLVERFPALKNKIYKELNR